MLHPAYTRQYTPILDAHFQKSNNRNKMCLIREAKALDIAKYVILSHVYNLSA